MILTERKHSTVIGTTVVLVYLLLSILTPYNFSYLYLVGLSLLIMPSLLRAVKSTLRLEIKVDTLMVIASIGAVLLGNLGDAVIILILYNVAEILEDVFTDKAKRSLEELTKDLPRIVTKIQNGTPREVNVEDCRVGDIVIIKPGQMVPFDGEVVESHTFVDESNVTGEPYPVYKPVGSKVISGSVVLKKPLKLRIEKDFDNSFLKEIVRRVLDSLNRRSKFERYVHRVANSFSPIVLLGFLVVLAWGYLTNNFSLWVYRALAILVVGCPSAFLISTSIASYITLSNLLRSGVIVKGSYILELLANAKFIAIDKTGTVTVGKPILKRIIPLDGVDEDELLRLAFSVEIYSSHPIAKVIVEEASKRSLEPLDVIEVEEFLGKGIVGKLKDGRSIYVGNKELLTYYRINYPELVVRDGIIIYVAIEKSPIGIIQLQDELFKGAINLGKKLRELGLEAVLVTGDRKAEAERIAKELDVEKWYAEMKPKDKLEVVRSLKKKGITIMVGDGINDAMALSEADVGIAVTEPGMDIVKTSSGIEIHKWEDISIITKLIKLSRKYISTLKKIVYLAILTKLFLIILALAGYLPLWGAVLGDDGLTIALSIYTLKQKLYLKYL